MHRYAYMYEGCPKIPWTGPIAIFNQILTQCQLYRSWPEPNIFCVHFISFF